jgi:hypothetical protein
MRFTMAWLHHTMLLVAVYNLHRNTTEAFASRKHGGKSPRLQQMTYWDETRSRTRNETTSVGAAWQAQPRPFLISSLEMEEIPP